MKHVWSILCQNSIIDSDTNSLSLYNCLAQLVIDIDKNTVTSNETGFNIPVQYDLVSFWIDEEIAKERGFFVEIDLVDPSNKKLGTTTNNYTLIKGTRRLRSRIKTQGISITTEGRYWFKVKMKEKKNEKFKQVAELPLDVKINYKLLDTKNNSK